jgi:hypothetical protein
MLTVTIPDWKGANVRYGTMVRTALWLVQEIGLGNAFTKDQHRSAFPGVAQADRRLRDLRAHGWIIHTSLEDVSLNQSEQRFVAMGSAVWDPVARKSVGARKLTDKQRMAVFAETDYQCNICGIAGGERYRDKVGANAVLSAASRNVTHLGGKEETIFLAECKRCSAGNVSNVEDLPEFLNRLVLLESEEKSALVKLIVTEENQKLLGLWREFRRMSAFSRAEIRKNLT